MTKLTKAWQEEVFAKYKLMFVQRFSSGTFILCDHCSTQYSSGLWQDWEGKGHALCVNCRANPETEPMIEGVGYRPTQYPKAQPVDAAVENVNKSA